LVCKIEEKPKNVRYERNAQDQNHRQKEHSFCSKLKRAPIEAEASLYREYVLCLSRSIESLFNYGFACRRRFKVSYGLQKKIQRNVGQIFHSLHFSCTWIPTFEQYHSQRYQTRKFSLDDKGYLRTTDLGIARIVKPNNNADTSGTPGYMAPEVMCRQDHSFPVDYYAVGVIAYELMLGRRPYYGRNRKEIRDQILSKQVQIKQDEIPPGWSL